MHYYFTSMLLSWTGIGLPLKVYLPSKSLKMELVAQSAHVFVTVYLYLYVKLPPRESWKISLLGNIWQGRFPPSLLMLLTKLSPVRTESACLLNRKPFSFNKEGIYCKASIQATRGKAQVCLLDGGLKGYCRHLGKFRIGRDPRVVKCDCVRFGKS